MDITTVADDLIVCHDGETVARYENLQPATRYNFLGAEITTLPRPSGELLCRLATVNDVHFGEVDCGAVDDHAGGPIQRVGEGEPPYTETMNGGAVAEIAEIEPTAVIVKGDLSQDGEQAEWDAFERCYRSAFGDRLHVVRGNHDAYHGQNRYAGDQWIELPGVCIALLDTVIPEHTTGNISSVQLDWLDAHAADADRPVLVMGHHQQWIGGKSGTRPDDYFGLHPDGSDALNEVVTRRRRIIAYTAGHTHRHRHRPMACGVPSIEVGCVKDFPGTWAEYRVFESGVMQVVHRVSSGDAVAWSQRCRHLYSDFGIDYETYALGKLEDRCCNIPLR
ncbi:MAG: metallophosphoesterase [Actinobacteria bacterium]|nr:metallophosphoesterase [Actinomycetota bacterium]